MNQISPTNSRPISTASRATEVPPLTGAERDHLDVLANALEQTGAGRYQMPDTALPVPSERQWLEQRAAVLQRSLVRPNASAVASVIAGMFLRFPPAGQASDMEGRISAYVADLQGLPLWAIERAVASLRGPWAPASNVLVDAVHAVLVPTRDELAKVTRLLTADVYHVPSDEERARVKARFDLLLAELKLRQDFGGPPRPKSVYASPQRPEDWLAARAADPGPAPILSPDALRTLSLPPIQEAAE